MNTNPKNYILYIHIHKHTYICIHTYIHTYIHIQYTSCSWFVIRCVRFQWSAGHQNFGWCIWISCRGGKYTCCFGYVIRWVQFQWSAGHLKWNSFKFWLQYMTYDIHIYIYIKKQMYVWWGGQMSWFNTCKHLHFPFTNYTIGAMRHLLLYSSLGKCKQNIQALIEIEPL